MDKTVKVKIVIMEGCTSYSYCIDGVEWVELTDKHSKSHNPNIVNAVCDALVDEFIKQYPGIPVFLIDNLYEVDSGNPDLDFNQDIFIDLVKNNKNTEYKYIGSCEECGDLIYTWTLTVNVPLYNLD
jgi:hypothetical protein